MAVEALTQMEAWLAAIRADDARGHGGRRTLRNRPVALTTPAGRADDRIDEPFGLGLAGTCEALYPTLRRHRIAAGAPLETTCSSAS